jgi:cation/acetate symporter
VLVALLLAPYLRKFGQFTIPDFLGARYEGHFARVVGVFAGVLASFVYVVAQIYGVGLITSRFIGIEFEIGVFVGLAGILVCSFLGGMRAVTWTQVAQYVILIVAYLVPVTILSYKVTGVPVPQVCTAVLQDLGVKELELFSEPRENAVHAQFRARADEYARKIVDLPESLAAERTRRSSASMNCAPRGAGAGDRRAERACAICRARRTRRLKWERARQDSLPALTAAAPHAEAHPGADQRQDSARNFIALTFVLMVGTAAAPHPDALLHHAQRARGAALGVLVAVLHLPAVCHGAGLCGVRQVGGL